MTDQNQIDGDEALLETAAGWFYRARAGGLKEAEAAELARWLDDSADHRTAYEEAKALWLEIGSFETVLRSQYEIAPPAQSPPRRTVVPVAVPCSKSWRYKAAAAALVMVVAGAVIFGAAGVPGERYRTVKGEQTMARLADGSVMHLNVKSSVAAEFNGRFRTITLDHGEVQFDVAHDEDRPFVVRAGGATIRALGTSFNVHKRGSVTTVTVLEGTVRLSLPPPEGFAPGKWRTDISAGEQVIYGDGLPLEKLADVDVDQVSSWRSRKLVFDQAPLGEVVAEFNNYGGDTITIAHGGLKDIKISGTFEADNTAALIEALAWVTGMRVVRVADTLTVLYVGKEA